MREFRKSGSMSGEGKRGDAQRAQATAPLLDFTSAAGIRFKGRRQLTTRSLPFGRMSGKTAESWGNADVFVVGRIRRR